MARLVARQRRKAACQASRPMSEGERAEFSHLLHDADPDSVTRPFPDLVKGIYRTGGTS
jgi:hypothetical protein